jgi:hypothetical protein
LRQGLRRLVAGELAVCVVDLLRRLVVAAVGVSTSCGRLTFLRVDSRTPCRRHAGGQDLLTVLGCRHESAPYAVDTLELVRGTQLRSAACVSTSWGVETAGGCRGVGR